MMEKISMGAYGAYVWTCYGFALLVVVLNEWRARRRHRIEYRDVEVLVKAIEEKR